MSASVHGDGARPGLRLTLAAVLLFDLFAIVNNFFVVPQPDILLPWSPHWLITLDVHTWPIVVLVIVTAVSIGGFARGRRAQLWFGLLALLCLAVLVESLAAHVGGHRRRFYGPGAVLAGWLVGLVVGRVRGADDARSERLAEAGAAGALAATYVNAGLQKLLAGGLFRDHTLQAHILTHHHVDDPTVFGSIARHVALDPQLAMGLALATVVIQFGAWVFLLGPRARVVWGTLLISFHLGTLLFLHIIYLGATILLVAWSFPWGRLAARLRGRPRAATRPEDPPLASSELVLLLGLATLFVGIAWVAPTPHELPRPEYHHPSLREAEAPAASEQDDAGNTVAELGPLAVGDWLGAWNIERIEIGATDARATLLAGGERITFGFAGSQGDAPEGPHSLGELHIYYRAPDGLSFTEIDAVGRALRERLVADVEDPAAAVDRWIEAARAQLPVERHPLVPRPFER